MGDRRMSPEMRMRFNAREDWIADRTTKEARRRAFPDDERTRAIGAGSGGDCVRIDIPAITTGDLKLSARLIGELAQNLKELTESSYKANDKIMLMRRRISQCNMDLRNIQRRSLVSYKSP